MSLLGVGVFSTVVIIDEIFSLGGLTCKENHLAFQAGEVFVLDKKFGHFDRSYLEFVQFGTKKRAKLVSQNLEGEGSQPSGMGQSLIFDVLQAGHHIGIREAGLWAYYVIYAKWLRRRICIGVDRPV